MWRQSTIAAPVPPDVSALRAASVTRLSRLKCWSRKRGRTSPAWHREFWLCSLCSSTARTTDESRYRTRLQGHSASDQRTHSVAGCTSWSKRASLTSRSKAASRHSVARALLSRGEKSPVTIREMSCHKQQQIGGRLGKQPGDLRAESHRNAIAAPTIGPHCPDHRTTTLQHWSDDRTTRPGLLVRSSGTSKTLGLGVSHA